jgi:hypothetical protein
VNELYTLSTDQVAEIQLHAARRRFAELHDRIPVVRKLAAQQGVTRIDAIDDIAPLLLSHTVYKSYPLSLLESGRFDLLTRWLGGLTPFDLSKLDARSCDSIDGWLELLETETPLKCLSTSGTTGKMSFVPRSDAEWDMCVQSYFVTYHQGFGAERHADLSLADLAEIPFVFFAYREGRHTQQRIVSRLVETIYKGDESMCRALFPSRMSMDVLSLAGRLKAASAKGMPDSVRISPALLAMRERFAAEQRDLPARSAAYFAETAQALGGRRIMFMGSWSSLFDGAVEGERLGLSNVFRADSLITTGGGFKGRVLPDDWYQRIERFLGVPGVHDGYGCSELIVPCQLCPHDHYHCSPAAIPFLLDPDTGAVLPRQGTQTGRFAFMDLMAHTYWGGFVTGDEVKMSWDEACECGRNGPYLHRAIRRFSEARGGDDKISCAGMPDAHREALDYLTGLG